jgi:hypothetical protein
MTRTRIKPERTAEIEAAARELFAAIDAARPPNIRCLSSKLSDGVTFVTVLHVQEGTENTLAALPAYREFQARLKDCLAEPPVAGPATVVGSYRMLE